LQKGVKYLTPKLTVLPDDGTSKYEISVQRKTNIYQIYTEMAFERQTDKEFAVSGRKTRDYMKSPRRLNPAIKKDCLCRNNSERR
jgi:hypothetical protein